MKSTAFAAERTDAREAAQSLGQFKLSSHARGDAGRASAEQFVRERFFRTHDACVQSFLPQLLTLTDEQGEVHGVVGCRMAEEEPLFLERYFDSPVETALSARVRASIPRTAIAEVGNLACRDSRAARKLISILPRYLLARGRTWIVFTATSSVRRLLVQAGARPIELVAARAHRVPCGPDEWGRYYDSDPRVMAGYLPAARGNPALWSATLED